MGQFEKTLVKTSRWRGPQVADVTLLATYREESQLKRLTFVGDELVVAVSLGRFPKQGVPEHIRVTVEWDEPAESPPPSSS